VCDPCVIGTWAVPKRWHARVKLYRYSICALYVLYMCSIAPRWRGLRIRDCGLGISTRSNRFAFGGVVTSKSSKVKRIFIISNTHHLHLSIPSAGGTVLALPGQKSILVSFKVFCPGECRWTYRVHRSITPALRALDAHLIDG
jgi:hypothetical protein